MTQQTKILFTTLLCAAGAWGTAVAQDSDATDVFSEETEESQAPADGYERFRVGGYGEMVAAFKDYGTNRFYGSQNGNVKMNRNTIAIPRFVLAGDYKFNRHWQLGAEIEFEAGGTGTAYEIENTENGEYETEVEKGGEVAIEQFHITYSLNRAFNVRAGHQVLPVGLTNAHHEPILFFGTVRPEGETTILPSTWHETGVSIFGAVGHDWSRVNYEAYVTAGLNANGFDRNTWAGSAKQGFFEEDNFTSPAYTARIEYLGIPGLRLGGSAYYCNNVGANSDKPNDYKGIGRIPVFIGTLDAQYTNRYVTARANCVWGLLDKTGELSNLNRRQSNGSPYSRTTPIAKKAVSYGAEVGLNIQGFVRNYNLALTPFVRYEYYNSQQEVEAPMVADYRLKTSMWTAGVNYRPIPSVVIKADYTTRRIGDGKCNRENEFAIGVAFTGWFYQR
ncbi:MAG: hypothetical protein IJ767_08280 [Bacteroidaceae bacterium]|nr:hypothetical protein [Bacteroidaceae bacterium]MBR1801466.1 hypothetical protein [Bacteroidaceae bacterium]